MLKLIRQSLPKPLKKVLSNIKKRTYDNWKKKLFFKRMQLKHIALLKKLKDKDKIKVVFLVLHKSVWKVDPLFKKMLEDPQFEPLILVCPYTSISLEGTRQDMMDVYKYFNEKGYPVISAYTAKGRRWRELSELGTDIVFFTNPYKLTKSLYYEEAYKNYLCCYVPYYFMATTHTGELSSQLNTLMLNSMWRIYWPHQYVFEQFSRHSVANGKNSKLTGYPATEVFLQSGHLKEQTKKAWKTQKSKKRKIIYAPHHTIENNDSSLSTFLQYGNFIRQLSNEYQDRVQWSFKPHPILKEKLCAHPDWGDKRTNEYYQYWRENPNTQLDLGGYDDLFNESDALIHDCSSFIVEYSFTKKPALYLLNPKNRSESFLNEFGKKIFENYKKAECKKDIVSFVDDIFNEKESQLSNKNSFFESYLDELYIKSTPSQKIIDDIKSEITH
jgi:hypothetical protein